MELKDISTEQYKHIKQLYKEEYVHQYNLALAAYNDLVGTRLYLKVIPYIKMPNKHYVVSLFDQAGNCIRIGWTSLSILDYWFNHLKIPGMEINYIKDINIIAADLEKKEAIRLSRELNKNLLQISRRYKISKLDEI